MTPSLPALTLALLLAATLPAELRAGDHEAGDSDHDRARAAVARGEALPLDRIMRLVGPTIAGEVVDLEFEQLHGRPVYELHVIDPSGRFVEIFVDARTGQRLPDGDD